MIAQLRSELLKLRTTRTSVALLGWMAGLVVLVVGLHVLSFSVADLSQGESQLRILGVGTTLGAMFAALVGTLAVTGEFRTGTIRPTLLVTPRRTRVVAAKLIACLLMGLVVGFVAAALTAGVEIAGLAARDIPDQLGGGDYVQLLAGGAFAGGLFAAIGVGVGAVVRNQVAGVVGVCVWLLFLEPLLLGNVAGVAKYAPGASAGAIAGAIQTEIADSLVAPGLGVALLIAYAALAALAGSLLITRRDVG